MTMPMIAPIRDQSELTRASRCLLHVRASDFALTAVGGQVGVLTRGAVATIADVNGNSFTAGYTQPTFEEKLWLGGSNVMMLRLGALDRLRFDAEFRPQALGFYHEFVQGGSMAAAAKYLWSIVANAGTGAFFGVDSDGTYYRVRHNNGTTDRNVSLTVAPTNGQRVQHWGLIYANGGVALTQSIEGAAPISVYNLTANTMAANWGTAPGVNFSTLAATAGQASFLRTFKLLGGFPTAAQLERTR